MNIGFATSRAYPSLTDDDRPLVALIRAVGHAATPVVWDDPSIEWAGLDAVVLRSTWDYHLRPAEFTAWLDLLDRLGVALWNPTSLVRWNMHKGYLRDLAARGILVPETTWYPRGQAPPIEVTLRERGWANAIVKPAISASATDTFMAAATSSDDSARFTALAARADVLVQELVPEVVTEGEWSLVFIGGTFSHATMKRPRPGDFRVQVELGGTAGPARAPADVVAAGERIAAEIPTPWLYARVDGVATPRGFMLMEVECIEPLLFLAHAPHAHQRFADALLRLAAVKP